MADRDKYALYVGDIPGQAVESTRDLTRRALAMSAPFAERVRVYDIAIAAAAGTLPEWLSATPCIVDPGAHAAYQRAYCLAFLMEKAAPRRAMKRAFDALRRATRDGWVDLRERDARPTPDTPPQGSWLSVTLVGERPARRRGEPFIYAPPGRERLVPRNLAPDDLRIRWFERAPGPQKWSPRAQRAALQRAWDALWAHTLERRTSNAKRAFGVWRHEAADARARISALRRVWIEYGARRPLERAFGLWRQDAADARSAAAVARLYPQGRWIRVAIRWETALKRAGIPCVWVPSGHEMPTVCASSDPRVRWFARVDASVERDYEPPRAAAAEWSAGARRAALKRVWRALCDHCPVRDNHCRAATLEHGKALNYVLEAFRAQPDEPCAGTLKRALEAASAPTQTSTEPTPSGRWAEVAIRWDSLDEASKVGSPRVWVPDGAVAPSECASTDPCVKWFTSDDEARTREPLDPTTDDTQVRAGVHRMTPTGRNALRRGFETLRVGAAGASRAALRRAFDRFPRRQAGPPTATSPRPDLRRELQRLRLGARVANALGDSERTDAQRRLARASDAHRLRATERAGELSEVALQVDLLLATDRLEATRTQQVFAARVYRSETVIEREVEHATAQRERARTMERCATHAECCAQARASLEATLALERVQASCDTARLVDSELADERLEHVRELQRLEYSIERSTVRLERERSRLAEDELALRQDRVRLERVRVAAQLDRVA